MADRDDPLEELRRFMLTAPPAIQRLHRIVCAILRPPPAEPLTGERPPTIH